MYDDAKPLGGGISSHRLATVLGASALGGRADAAWGYPGNRGDQTPGPADSKAQRRETGPPGPPGGHGPAATHRSSRRTPQAHGCAVLGSGSNVSRQPVSRSRFYITRAISKAVDKKGATDEERMPRAATPRDTNPTGTVRVKSMNVCKK